MSARGARLVVLAILVAPGAMPVAAQDRSVQEGVYTAAQAASGENLYFQYCASCHMPDLSGGEDAPPLAGAVFSGVWSGRPLSALVGKMEARMPEGAPGSLSRPAYTDLVAFLLRRNGFPAGSPPLGPSDDQLGAIRYIVDPAP